MKKPFQMRPGVAAVSSALALASASAYAQTFDPNSAAVQQASVQQAYVGAATQEKKDAALARLGLLAKQVRQSGGSGITLPGLSSVSLQGQDTGGNFVGDFQSVTPNVFFLFGLPLPSSPVTTLRAASDNDLGTPGAAVTLNNQVLQTLASFNTARNFTVGADGATIDTNGFNFGISGNVIAYGRVVKEGLGTLTLTGNNIWYTTFEGVHQNRLIIVANGVLEGNTASLQTSIINNATVRFNQSVDGVYERGAIFTSSIGNLEKSGPGKLTLAHPQLYGGVTSILGGTLALGSFGALGSITALNISNGATFDISGAGQFTHAVGTLSGSGNVLLGSKILSAGGADNSTFAGSISGAGGLVKTGNSMFTLSGVNSYTGATRVENGTLALQGMGRLSASSAVLISQATFDIAGADGAREVGSIGGAGSIRLGANTLTVGADNSSNTYHGVISGSGGLNKIGSASQTLTGANIYTGVTTINQGELVARAQSISANVVNNAALTLTEDGSAANAIYAGTISGDGKLAKSGSGTVTLTGVNTYTGATTIAGGTLALAGQGRLNAASSLQLLNGTFDIAGSAGSQELGSLEAGSGTIQLGNNTLTVGRNNTDNFFAGSILGSGGLTKTGTGGLYLSGFSNFSGTTTINQGNLIARVYSISDHVANNATLTLIEYKGATEPFLSAYSGNISGTGQLIKDSDGIIWLRGRNTYTGGTTVNSGYLIGNTDSLQGNISNNAALTFYQVDNGTYAGNLSGSGSLLQYGPGALTLTGNNTYTGGTAFSGTLRVDRDANLGAASGALVMAGGTLQIGADMTTARDIALAPAGGTFDTNGNRLTVSGSISGPGELAKSGAGTLTLTGANTYAGATMVYAGRLEVSGSLNSNIVVAAGAELGGSGVISSNFILNRGRLARGSGIGDIRVEGNFAFEPGSVFTVKANAAGDSDRLLVATLPFKLDPLALPAPSGQVTLNGGKVEVLAENGNYRRETRYNIVNAARGVSGQFAGVTSNLAFLSPSLAYDTNNVYLTLARNDINYAAVAQNPSQSAVAQGLTRMTAVTGDAATVTAVMDGLSAAQARAAFDSIGAAGRAALSQAGSFNQRSINQNLVARLGVSEGGGALAPATGVAGRALQIAFEESVRNDAAPVYAQAGMPAGGQGLRMAADPNNGFWLRGYGVTGRLDGDASAPGAKYNFGGTLFGYDRKIGNAVTLGVFGGYAEPRYEQDVAASSAHAKTYQVGAYGRVRSGAWHVDVVASYARNDTDTSRVVSVGALNRSASGSFKGDTVSAHVETGYTLKAGGFEVQPLAALSWVRQTQNAYSESGAGALNLVLPEQSQESLRSALGLRALHPFQAGATQAVFEARAAWSREFNNTRSINARLAGDPAAAVFTVSGPSLPRDSAVVGVGVAAQASRNLRLYADLNGEYNGRMRAGALSVGLRYQW